jgi:hypothetical protein
MTYDIPYLKAKMARVFGVPRVDHTRVLEALIGSACYLGLFYHLNLLVNTYFPNSNLIDPRLTLVLSALAITRAIFKDSLISALTGLTSVTLMFNLLYQTGCLNHFGTIETTNGLVSVVLKFPNLLAIILIVMGLKTLLYVLEVVEKSKSFKAEPGLRA